MSSSLPFIAKYGHTRFHTHTCTHVCTHTDTHTKLDFLSPENTPMIEFSKHALNITLGCLKEEAEVCLGR